MALRVFKNFLYKYKNSRNYNDFLLFLRDYEEKSVNKIFYDNDR